MHSNNSPASYASLLSSVLRILLLLSSAALYLDFVSRWSLSAHPAETLWCHRLTRPPDRMWILEYGPSVWNNLPFDLCSLSQICIISFYKLLKHGLGAPLNSYLEGVLQL